MGNDELDVGDSEVASSEVGTTQTQLGGLQSHWTRDPMSWLWFSRDTGTKTFDNQFLFVIFVFYSLIRFE